TARSPSRFRRWQMPFGCWRRVASSRREQARHRLPPRSRDERAQLASWRSCRAAISTRTYSARSWRGELREARRGPWKAPEAPELLRCSAAHDSPQGLAPAEKSELEEDHHHMSVLADSAASKTPMGPRGVRLPQARSVRYNPSAAELQELTRRMPEARRTSFGNYNVQTRVTSRSTA